MPGCDEAYFSLLCSEAELRPHLEVCANSDFEVTEHEAIGGLSVTDGDTALLLASRTGGGWLVRLHRKYYRHPFGPASDGNGMPGAP